MAVLKGARVIATVGSAAKAALARAAGVTDTIDYKTENVTQRVKDLTGGRGVDGIVDMDFSTTSNLVREGALAPHGTVACYGSNSAEDPTVPFRIMLFTSLSLQFFLVYDLSAADRAFALRELSALLETGRLTHTIGARFKLEDIAAAHEAVERGTVLGNVVIDLE